MSYTTPDLKVNHGAEKHLDDETKCGIIECLRKEIFPHLIASMVVHGVDDGQIDVVQMVLIHNRLLTAEDLEDDS